MDKLSELLKSVRPATKEELREQGENLAKNYKPGPRQAVPFLPVMEAGVEQELPAEKEGRDHLGDKPQLVELPPNSMKKLAELLQEAGAIPVIDGVSIYEDRISMSKPRFQELMAEIATLQADGTKAAEELSQTREALRAQATGAAGQARRNIALADELARERERHQELWQVCE